MDSSQEQMPHRLAGIKPCQSKPYSLNLRLRTEMNHPLKHLFLMHDECMRYRLMGLWEELVNFSSEQLRAHPYEPGVKPLKGLTPGSYGCALNTSHLHNWDVMSAHLYEPGVKPLKETVELIEFYTLISFFYRRTDRPTTRSPSEPPPSAPGLVLDCWSELLFPDVTFVYIIPPHHSLSHFPPKSSSLAFPTPSPLLRPKPSTVHPSFVSSSLLPPTSLFPN